MKKAIKAIVGIALALSFAVIPSAINSGDSASSSIATVSASVVHEENINLTGYRVVGRKCYVYHLSKVRVTTDSGTQYYASGYGWRNYNWFTYIG